MQEGRTRGTTRRAAALFAAASIGAPAGAASAAGGSEAADRMSTRALVAGASARAAAKMLKPECREVLSDFRDGAGRPLSEILEERGVGVGEFLASLSFVDGGSVPRCASGTVAAGATPGSPSVAVCKATFARVDSADPGLAANVVIHEMLHALGLGEDPPTSEEITRQVARRCGR